MLKVLVKIKNVRLLITALWIFRAIICCKMNNFLCLFNALFLHVFKSLGMPFSSRELSIVVGHHDVVSLRELLCSGILPLLHNLQVQWSVSVCRSCIYSMEMGHMILLHCLFYVLLNSRCFDTKWLVIIFLAMLSIQKGFCLILLNWHNVLLKDALCFLLFSVVTIAFALL